MTGYILFAIFVILQAADVLTTYKALMEHGASEANPIVNWIMGRIGVVPALVASKIIICAIVGTVVFYHPSIYLDVALGAVCCVYALVVSNNYRIIRGV